MEPEPNLSLTAIRPNLGSIKKKGKPTRRLDHKRHLWLRETYAAALDFLPDMAFAAVSPSSAALGATNKP